MFSIDEVLIQTVGTLNMTLFYNLLIMETINLTFGEGNEMGRQKPDLYELVESLTKQLAALKLQLGQVQAEKRQ